MIFSIYPRARSAARSISYFVVVVFLLLPKESLVQTGTVLTRNFAIIYYCRLDNNISKSSLMTYVFVRLVGQERLFYFDFALRITLPLVLVKRCCYNSAEEVGKISCET